MPKLYNLLGLCNISPKRHQVVPTGHGYLISEKDLNLFISIRKMWFCRSGPTFSPDGQMHWVLEDHG